MYRSRIISLLIFGLCSAWLSPPSSWAIPTQYGATGLFSQPTADTLNAGNICLGLWTNSAETTDGNATIVPVAMTLGLGSFIEAYGSYPNLLFNGDELQSGRGYANIGFKLRVVGSRASAFKLALDGQFRRFIAEDPALDGLTDKVGRVIVSVKPGKFGFHLSGGYSDNEAPEGATYENQILYGGGIEYYPTTRLRLLAEYESASEKIANTSSLDEATLGFQYFFSPHLTLNMGFGVGFSDASPDWRMLFGFSTCQGVGTYTKPVPRAVAPVDESQTKATEKAKVIKVRTLTPLVPKSMQPQSQPQPQAQPIPQLQPVSKYEVPVTPNGEEVVIEPSERLALPVAGLSAALPVAPVAAAPAATAAAPITVAKTGRTFKVADQVKTDDGVVVGRKTVDDPRFVTNFISIKEYPEYFQLVFFHRYNGNLPVRIEGEVKYALSTSSAQPLEDVDLKVYRVDGRIPAFNLHIGETSEVFAFDAAENSADLPQQTNMQDTAASTASEKPLVAVVYRKFRLPSFAFGFDEWSLADEGKRALSEIVEELRKEKPGFIVRIDGYTDNIGSAEYNYNLGLRRAVTAATYLVSNAGFDPALLFVKSVGETAPVATNESEEGRLQNRRIELLILLPKDGV